MNEDRYIAALEISSSKIIGCVGRYRGAGHLDVIAVEQEKGVECVRYGIIQNLEETSLRIARIIDKLQRRPQVAPRKITGFFVGLSGRSLRSITSESVVNLPDDTEITDDIIERLRNEAFNSAIDSSLEVVDAVPRSYIIGKTETLSPKGALGNRISATFDLVVCRPEIKRNISRTLPDKLDISVEGFVVTALAAGHTILSSEQKRLGCMMIDLGAETTTVTIYKNGHLCYFATLPLGGRNITRDITTLNLLEERAEEIKVTSGNALASETTSSLNLNGVKLADVANIIVSRSEEIVANIVEQIEYAGLKTADLPGGIVCIGGGACLNGMMELIRRQTSLPVSSGQLPSFIRLEDTKTSVAEAMEVISILYEGATLSTAECLEIPSRPGLPVTGEAPDDAAEDSPEEPERPAGPTWRTRMMAKIKNGVTNFFAGNDADDNELI